MPLPFEVGDNHATPFEIELLICPECKSDRCSFQRPASQGFVCHACGHKWTAPGVENLKPLSEWEGPIEDF